jgi:DNA repair protein RecO (recombination protein O)
MKSRLHGFVIYKQKVRDNMMVVKVFTQENGLQSFWFRPKKGQRPLHGMDEISFIDFGDQREHLHWMKEVELQNPFHQMDAHPAKAASVLFMQEVLYRLLEENDANPPLYFFLQEIMGQLQSEADVSLIHFVFLIGLMRSAGCCPVPPMQDPHWFGMEAGEFGFHTPPTKCISRENHQLKAFIALLKGDYEELRAAEMLNADRRQLLKALIDYLFIQQHKINQIRSLDIYYELFHA